MSVGVVACQSLIAETNVVRVAFELKDKVVSHGNDTCLDTGPFFAYLTHTNFE